MKCTALVAGLIALAMLASGCGDDSPTEASGGACSLNLSSMSLHTTYVINNYGQFGRECYRQGSSEASLVITNVGKDNLSGTVSIQQPEHGIVDFSPEGTNENFTIPPGGAQTYTFRATAEELCMNGDPAGTGYTSHGSIEISGPCQKSIPVTVVVVSH